MPKAAVNPPIPEPSRDARKIAWRFLRRRLIVACLAGVFGMIASGWICAWFVNPRGGVRSTGQRGDVGHHCIATQWRRAGAVEIFVQRYAAFSDMKRSPITPQSLTPSWTTFDTPRDGFLSAAMPYESRVAKGFGWPLPCLWWEVDRARSVEPVERGALAIGRHRLPLRPIWLGALANAGLAALIALLAPPLLIRRFRRLRRYACIRCGYPIGTSARCTECGFALDRQRASSKPAR